MVSCLWVLMQRCGALNRTVLADNFFISLRGEKKVLVVDADTELKRTQHSKFLHLDWPSHVSHTPCGLIQANVFTVNKPCGMKFN